MKNVKRVVLEITAKALHKMNDIYTEGWPPCCVGIFHQPKRPITNKTKI